MIEQDPRIKMYARQLVEYGESREGYWTSDKFMLQIKEAVKLNTPEQKDGGWCGFLTTAVAMADDSPR